MLKVKLAYEKEPASGAPGEFEIEPGNKIAIGRDPRNQVVFEDSNVSRNHAEIEIDPSDPGFVVIRDLGSTNKTFVNGQMVDGDVRVVPGATVRLGIHGPTFTLDTDPRPLLPTALDKLTGTRAEPLVGGTIGDEPAQAAHARKPAAPAGGGQNAVVGVLVVLAIGAVAFAGFSLYKSRANENETKAVASNEATATTMITAEVIADSNRDSVIKVRTTWQLSDANRSQTVYHRQYTLDGRKYGVYIRYPDGLVEPLLTRDAAQGRPIYGSAEGSGFVVKSNGFIITNRHVAAPWTSPITLPPDSVGLVVIADAEGNFRFATAEVQPLREPWDVTTSRQADREGFRLEGMNVVREVFWPNSTQAIYAHLTQISSEHDVALLKVDSAAELRPVSLAPDTPEVKQGNTVYVLGYPSTSVLVIEAKGVKDLVSRSKVERIPYATLGKGIVGLVAPASKIAPGRSMFNVSGEALQMSDMSVGSGGSGSPVFNERGEVVGVYWAMLSDDKGINVPLAVPIKYAKKLLER